jgi:hypothetical protein
LVLCGPSLATNTDHFSCQNLGSTKILTERAAERVRAERMFNLVGEPLLTLTDPQSHCPYEAFDGGSLRDREVHILVGLCMLVLAKRQMSRGTNSKTEGPSLSFHSN